MAENEYLKIMIHFSGKYEPKFFLEKCNYPYTIIHEINTIAKTGRNKGKLSDESFCCFTIGDTINHNEKIKKAVELTLDLKKEAKRQRINIEYFCFTLAYSGIQGNMELSKEEIKWLRKLNCCISINYIFNEPAKE
jgi:hypothetical protein